MAYPRDRLFAEVAFLAYYFHWDYGTIMNMEHRERQQWCEEISRMHRELNSEENRNRNILEV